jgi:autotransporter passenger strand-loop-strand repeat protein
MATITVSSGVPGSSLALTSGDVVDVVAGGTLIATTVGGGVSANVSSGGLASALTIAGGGSETVLASGTDTGASVTGGHQSISSGGTVLGAALSAGGDQIVFAGGVAGDTAAEFGGYQFVSSGGSAVATSVAFGYQIVASGGTASGTVLSGGHVGVAAGGTIAGTVISNGFAIVSGGVAFGTTISGGVMSVFSGGVASDTTIDGGAAVLAPGAAASGAIAFGSAGELVIGGTAMPAATISGFAPAGANAADRIDLAAAPFASDGTASLGPGNVLTVSEGGKSYALDFDRTQSFEFERFELSTDLGGGTAITLEQVACFLAGTRLATERGDVAVELLAVGDLLRTPLGGGAAPIRWIGHRCIDATRHPRPLEVWPVRVRAHAFGLGRPRRDLLLSPDHAIHVDCVLIPARCLLNGATVVRTRLSPAHYFHVELDCHDIVLAEGLPAETYLDLGNRGAFSNGGGARALHPSFGRAIWERRGCAELILGGPVLERVRARLLVQAGLLGRAAPQRAM